MATLMIALKENTIRFKDVLRPYIVHPDLLFRLWAWAAPAHFTVFYFHVYPQTRYLTPSDHNSYHSGKILVAASRLREMLLTRHYLALVLAGVVCALFGSRLGLAPNVSAATMLLTLFSLSQFGVCLLGEGIRDLSKHLAAAQFCLDLLAVFVLIQIAYLPRRLSGHRIYQGMLSTDIRSLPFIRRLAFKRAAR